MRNLEEEKIKRNIKRAIELYKELYQEVMEVCDAEIQTASSQSLVNKLYANLKNVLSLNAQTSTLSKEEQKAIYKLQLVTQYAESVKSARQVILDTKRLKELQSYIKGGVKVPSGVEDSARLQVSMELMRIIHNEFQKTRKMAKGGVECERAVVESIISKALKEKALFTDVDLSEASPARAVLNEILTFIENQKYINVISQIFETRNTSLQLMRELSAYGEDKEKQAKVNAGQVQNLLCEKFGVQEFSEEVPSFEQHKEEVEKRILEISMSENEGSDAIVKKLHNYKKETITSIDEIYDVYTRVLELLPETDSLFNETTSRYTQLLDSVPALVGEVKTAHNLDPSRGFVDGINLYGTSHILSFDTETGSKIEKGKADEDILITDESLLTVLLTRVLVHASCIKNNYKKQLDQCTSIIDVERTLGEYKDKLIELQSALEEDYKKVKGMYDKLIYYRAKLDSFPLDTKRSLSRFMNRFDPMSQNPRFHYFNDKQLEGIRKFGRRALISQIDEMKSSYLDLSANIGKEIVSYLTSLNPRTSLDEPTAPYVDLHTVSMNAGAMAEDNAKEVNVEAEAKEDEEKVTIFELLDADFDANEAFSRTLSGSTDVKVILSNPRYRATLSALVPFLGLEAGLSELETMRRASKESDVDRRFALLQCAISCDQFLSMKEVSKTNSFLTDEFYEYLASRMAGVCKLVEEIGSEYMAMIKEAKGRASVSTQAKLSAKAYYSLISYCGHWLEMLHSMDNDIICAGKEICVADRDMKLEAVLIERYKKQLEESKRAQEGGNKDLSAGGSAVQNRAVNLAPLV